MKRFVLTGIIVASLTIGGLIVATSSSARAGTGGITLKFENERVRVLELRLKPGESEGMHTHPDYVLYALTDYRVKNTSADGTVRVFDRKHGDVFWGKPVTHRGENVGDTEVHAIIVELKEAKPN